MRNTHNQIMHRAVRRTYFRPEFSPLRKLLISSSDKQSHMRLVLPVKDHELHSQKPLKIYWKPLLEIYLFGSKKNINYQIKFTLNLHINHFFTPEMK